MNDQKMDPITKSALLMAIEKWKNLYKNTVDGEGLSWVDLSACPLCEVFKDRDGGLHSCKGCPVMEKTGREVCQGTPYYSAFRAKKDGDLERFEKHALDEWAFLENLLPEEAE